MKLTKQDIEKQRANWTAEQWAKYNQTLARMNNIIAQFKSKKEKPNER
ncbi:MAG: hypothetical protein ACREBR_05060 [bacterium]